MVRPWREICSPPFQLSTSKIKPTFLSINLVSLLAFEWQAAKPHFQFQCIFALFIPGKNAEGLPFPTPGDFSDPGIEPTSLALTGKCFTTRATGEAPIDVKKYNQKCLCYSERCELPLSSSFFPCCWFLKVSEQTANLVVYLILSLQKKALKSWAVPHRIT